MMTVKGADLSDMAIDKVKEWQDGKDPDDTLLGAYLRGLDQMVHYLCEPNHDSDLTAQERLDLVNLSLGLSDDLKLFRKGADHE